MGYTKELDDLRFKVGEVVGLLFTEGTRQVVYPFQVKSYELPNNYYNFSLGTATPLSTTGTGWSSIQDSANRYILTPPQQGQLYQGFYGVSPAYTWLYRAYPANVIRGGLQVPVGVGSQYGFVDGWLAPYRQPAPVTEFWTAYGLTPAFNGYVPLGLPNTPTIYMNFYVFRYQADLVNMRPKRIIPVGGNPPVDTPAWMQVLAPSLGLPLDAASVVPQMGLPLPLR